MSSRQQSNAEDEPVRRKPAASREERENELIALAVDVVERRLRDNTATSQEVVHFLKLGSTRERLEQQRLKHETALIEARVNDLAATARIEELYKDAISAMKIYQGVNDVPPVDD